MAGADRMTIEQVVRKVLIEDHADVIRESVRFVAQQMMEAEVVRHEALLDRAGCETPTAGCRSSLWKRRAAWTRSRGRGWEAALTTTGRAGTARRCGSGKRDEKVHE